VKSTGGDARRMPVRPPNRNVTMEADGRTASAFSKVSCPFHMVADPVEELDCRSGWAIRNV